MWASGTVVQFAQYWRDHAVCLSIYGHTPMSSLYCAPITVVMDPYPEPCAPVCVEED